MLREWDNLNFRLGAYLWQHHRWWRCIVTNSRLSLSSLFSSLRWNNLNFRLGSYLWHQLREPSLSPHSTSCKRFFQTEGVGLEVNRGVLGEKGGGIGVKRGRFGGKLRCVVSKVGEGGWLGCVGWKEEQAVASQVPASPVSSVPPTLFRSRQVLMYSTSSNVQYLHNDPFDVERKNSKSVQNSHTWSFMSIQI